MKVLKCHTYYQVRGGEDESFDSEAELLESRGVEVVRFTLHNDAIHGMAMPSIARRAIWNHEVFVRVRELIRRERPDVMHCTNSFPLLSPSAHYAARAEGVPVVQALHNFRLLCTNGFLFHDGRVCEDCLHTALPWPAVAHGCYRGSRAGSAVVAAVNVVHSRAGAWRHAVDLFATPSEFARQKFVDSGFPSDRVIARPNFLKLDPGPGRGSGGYAVFVGRLSGEKGLDTLLGAWKTMRSDLRLKIVGDGPERGRLAAAAAGDSRIELVGRLSQADTLAVIGSASCLIMPSLWYETFGRVAMEALAVGTPVIASRLGAMIEIVTDGQTGALFEAGNAAALSAAVDGLVSEPARLVCMRSAARRRFLEGFTADRGYDALIAIYRRVVAEAASRTRAAAQSRQSVVHGHDIGVQG
jgi:glycosyltransferase involved in cell wall biosynthesis